MAFDIDYKSFFDAIEELKERAREGWVIIVEGQKDVESLRNAGIEGEIITFCGYAATADSVGDRNAIILTDFDRKGMEIEKGLVEALMVYGKVPNTEIKRKIFHAVRKEISKVEEISAFIDKVSFYYRA